MEEKTPNILYFGNKLLKYGINPTTIDYLSVILQKTYNVTTCSERKNKLARLFDMVFTLIREKGSTNLILIDTYSTLNFWYAVIIALLAKKFSIPYIPILHGGNLPKRLNKNRSICKTIFGNSYMNVCPSNYLYNAFKNAGFNNLKIIHNPIDGSMYNPIIRNQITIPKLLWVRSFRSIYNPQMAVKVLNILHRHYPDAELCMIGGESDSSFKETKQLAAQYGLTKHITFTGKLSKTEWINKSKEYNIFINTTSIDNTPVSVIEAMSLGFPVVSTNVGGIPYIITHKETGMLVENNNPQQMADTITKIVAEPDLCSKLSENATKEAHSYFSENVLKEWTNLINQI